MGRISIPNIPLTSRVEPSRKWSIAEAAEHISQRLSAHAGSSLIMTGAGVSVDSGIAPYRGEGGHYTIHKNYRPIFFAEFMGYGDRQGGHTFRQRYYARSYLGFPPVRAAKPNVSHNSIAALQRLGYVPKLITQNVDSLHLVATPSASLAADTIVELHGSLASVVCVASPQVDGGKASAWPVDPAAFDAMSATGASMPRSATPRSANTLTPSAYPKGCGFRGSRTAFQDALTQLNPAWHDLANEMARDESMQPKRNPDGDVELGNSTDYTSFLYPCCPNCGGILKVWFFADESPSLGADSEAFDSVSPKPAVTFFGESIPDSIRDTAHSLVEQSSFLLLIGSSLATYSAFRLVKQAEMAGLDITLLNIGPTRADALIPNKIELGSSEVLRQVALSLAGIRGREDPILARLLSTGVMIKPQQAMMSS